MHLWTEYEGHVVAGKYTLGALQRSEGRNGFFLTESAGTPAMLRLTEALNDEGELMTRWEAAKKVAQANLLSILDFGRTALVGEPLAWVVMERSDASLADVLRERALTVDETKEVGIAVVSALAAVHEAGLVHEHVDVSNVLAVGEVVKLRSDCVRECVGEFENDTPKAREVLRQRDLHDVGLLLKRCLVPVEGQAANAPLPAPFDRVVPRALDGSWPLSEILIGLTGIRPAPAVVPVEVGSEAVEAGPQFRPRKAYQGTALPRLSTLPPVETKRVVATEMPVAVAVSALAGTPFGHALARASSHPVRLYWAGGAIAAGLIGIVLFNTGRSHTVAVEPRVAVAAVPPAVSSAAAPSAASRSFLTSMHPGWQVIAYTYNYEQQARAKAEALQKRYVALQPHVFSPTGHAPYFVALGNDLGQDEAATLLRRARRAGLPRDTYIRAF